MDTHQRLPEEESSIIYGEWVVYTHPSIGDILATVQGILPKENKNPELPPYYPDTHYSIVGGRVKYRESFKCSVLFTKQSTGVGIISRTYSGRIRPLTEKENHELELYFKGEYALLINSELLKEAVKKNLKQQNFTDRKSIFL